MSAQDQRLYFLIQQVAHLLKKEADGAVRAASGLSTAQAAALTIIVSENGVSQSFIAEQLGQRESAVQTMAERLVKAGYVTRQRSDRDGRAWELRATPQGRSALKKISKPFSEINRLIDNALETSDADHLSKALRSILDAVEKSV